ncbi:MAG TPA: DUF4190 domain-containing protein [Actinocrinis sp.]
MPEAPIYGQYPVYSSPYPYAMMPPRRNGLALAGMILGIIGLLGSIVILGAFVGVVGLILALIGLSTARRTGAGRGFAITGIVTSALSIVIGIIVLIVALQNPTTNTNGSATACRGQGTSTSSQAPC